MSKAKPQSNLLGLVEDSDDELDHRVAAKKAPAKEAGKMPAAKKTGAAGRGAANRVAKPAAKSSGRRLSGRIAAAVQSTTERDALTEKSSNEQVASRGRGRKPAAKESTADAAGGLATPPNDEATKTKGTRGRPRGPKAAAAAAAAAAAEVPESVAKPEPARRGRKPTKKVEEEEEPTELEIPETQQPQPMDLDEEDEPEDVEALPPYQNAGLGSVQRPSYQAPFSATRRPPVAADMEGDVSLRRRLGEMSKKYESLELKYRDLREVAVKEAELNFDRLKKQVEEKTKASNQLIASLKSEVASQKELAKEGQRFKKQLEASEAKADSLQAKATELATTLSEAKAEIKALSTKLAAVRTGDPKVPGSAMKSGMAGSRNDASAVSASQGAQMKENLYGDLTGLIIRGVKHEGADDVFDCIQTGRNGALHFRLAVADESSGNYDEAEFMYMPQMDPGRDQALLDMLPDYLVEEITFPRLHAAKFYSRLMKSLTERQE